MHICIIILLIDHYITHTDALYTIHRTVGNNVNPLYMRTLGKASAHCTRGDRPSQRALEECVPCTLCIGMNCFRCTLGPAKTRCSSPNVSSFCHIETGSCTRAALNEYHGCDSRGRACFSLKVTILYV